MTDKDRDILVRALDAELTPPDRRRLAHLLETSSEAQAEWSRHHAVRRALAAEAAASFGPQFADRVVRRVAGAPPDRRRSSAGDRAAVPRRRLVRPAWSVAAVLLVAAVGLVLWLRPATYVVPHGTTASVTLPDGSTVELGSGSTLRYERPWSLGGRDVRLEGEAFFDVVPGAEPFVVETFNARVEVLGTRFNVRAWPVDEVRETAVTVASGRVAVGARGAEPGGRRAATRPPVLLTAGQATVVAADTAAARPPQPASVERALAWREGVLDFRDQPLSTVLASIERRFDVAITARPAVVSGRRLTYYEPRPASAEAVLSTICYSLDLQYRRTANGFEILTE